MNNSRIGKWMDITIPLRNNMITWAGDTVLEIEPVLDTDKGDEVNVSRITMSSHAGTHMDAPKHYIPGAEGIDSLAPESLVGEARVIEIMNCGRIQASDLKQHNITAGERILLKTRNSLHAWWERDFSEDFVCLEESAAYLLAEKGITLVGADYLSVASYREGTEVHRILLGAGICIVEGLNLTRVVRGRYEFICLPLKIEDGDGSPVRAVVRLIEAED